jgi:hypothetical protein
MTDYWFAALLVCVACGGGGKIDDPGGPPIGKVLAAVVAAADENAAPWRCAATDVPTLADEEFAIGEQTWKLTGHRLARTGTSTNVTIGVVADAAGAAPRTIAALGRTRAAFEAAKADVVITLGGMGATRDELQATLGTLSDHAAWPVIALPGDLEPMDAHLAAIAALRTRGDRVLDGRSIRWLDVGPAVLGTVPGAGAVERSAAGAEGCTWAPEDVAKVATELTTKSGVRILASAEGPREMLDGEAAGELGLVASKALFPVEIALHGPLAPAPTAARTGGRDGAGVGLSPGTADATPRLPGAHRSSAGILVVRGGSWSWRPIVDNGK